MGLKHWSMSGMAPHEYVFESGTVGGRPGATLRCIVSPATSFGAFSQAITASRYLTKRIRLSADLRTVDVTGWAGLWMRVDGQSFHEMLGFDNMEQRALTGTTDWQRHEIVLDIDPRAHTIIFGALLAGEGTLSVAAFAFEEVSLDVPTTGAGFTMPAEPANLGFTEPD